MSLCPVCEGKGFVARTMSGTFNTTEFPCMSCDQTGRFYGSSPSATLTPTPSGPTPGELLARVQVLEDKLAKIARVCAAVCDWRPLRYSLWGQSTATDNRPHMASIVAAILKGEPVEIEE